ncbi:MAG: hypothetical protein ABL923_09135 [Burkholderiaceae bacterium]
MKKQILNIAPLQTAKIMAALWFVISLPFLLIMGLAMFTMPGEARAAFGGMMIFMPVFYAISGFIFTLIGAWVYNLLAKRMGGIEYTTQDV